MAEVSIIFLKMHFCKVFSTISHLICKKWNNSWADHPNLHVFDRYKKPKLNFIFLWVSGWASICKFTYLKSLENSIENKNLKHLFFLDSVFTYQ